VKKDSCFDPACYSEKLTRFIAASNLVQLAGDYRPVPQGSAIVPRSKYTVLKPGDRCSHATQGIVAIGHKCRRNPHRMHVRRMREALNRPTPPMPAAFNANPNAEDEPEPTPIQDCGKRDAPRSSRPAIFGASSRK